MTQPFSSQKQLDKLFENKFNNLRKLGKTIEPKSEYFGIIGSTLSEDIPYELQLQTKLEVIRELYSEAGIAGEYEYIGSPQLWEYRLKMEFVCVNNPVHEPYSRFGQRKKGNFNWVVDMHSCNLVKAEWFNKTRQVYELMQSKGLQNYDLKKHTGFLRYLVLREYNNQAMLTIITSGDEHGEVLGNAADLALSLGFKSVYWIKNDTVSDNTDGEILRIYGDSFINLPVRIANKTFTFKVYPRTFFQNNISGFESLMEYVSGVFQGKDKTLFDLYCGTGIIGISLADRFKSVIGIDIVEDNIKAAVENKKLNGIGNIDFQVADLNQLMGLNIADGIVVLDPPRTGLGEGAIQALLSSRPSELVYISCNPLTQIQDYKRLSEIYLVKQSQGFDLFPHTYHMENVMHLIRR